MKYSAVVIQQMSERHSDKVDMQWVEMDVLDLKCGEEEFDIVIDKGAIIIARQR